MRWLRRLGIALATIAAAGAPAGGAVSLPALFSAHAVLLRDVQVPIWGRAAPGEDVTVRVAGVEAATRAGTSGRWRVTLDLSRTDDGPHELVVRGTNRIVVSDVMVGEVWLCAGQSNMEWALAATTGAAEELARPPNPRLRQFLVRRTGPDTPAEECDGRWIPASPATVGKFSGVGYHFGRRIGQEIGAVVGLINVGAGGTPIEGWMSAEALARDPAWQASLPAARRVEQEYPARLREYAERVADWPTAHRRADRPPADPATFAAPGGSLEGWQTIELPGEFASHGLPEAGALWLRRTVQVPEQEAVGLERGFQLSLGVITGADTVYWNGTRIGGTALTAPAARSLRRYTVPPSLLVRGAEATIAIRIFYPQGGVALTVPRDPPLVANTVPLDGEWWVRPEFAFEQRAGERLEPLPHPPARPRSPPSRQFNGLIAPLIPCALRGVVWYQGESNAPRAASYRESFALMLGDWRRRWDRGDFPIYFAQLANFDARRETPGESDWAELREAQDQTLALPNTGMAVTIDLGEELEIHPRNKRDVGERLARLALARTYDRPVTDSGPRLLSVSRSGPGLRIRFSNTHGGLVARPLPAVSAPTSTRPDRLRPLPRRAPAGEIEGFAICGADRQWHWAAAVIEGDTVVVTSPAVPEPHAVRYAWANHPVCNLYNGAGLPAAPFRTDDFPLTTATSPDTLR